MIARVDLLEYALWGVRMRIGALCDFPADNEEAEQLEADMETIKASLMRLKLKEATYRAMIPKEET